MLQSILELARKTHALREHTDLYEYQRIFSEAKDQIASLAYLFSLWEPFGVQGNRGALYIPIAQARRLTMHSELNVSPIDRMSNGLDLFLALGAHNEQEANNIYRAWSSGAFDVDFEGRGRSEEDDIGAILRRYSQSSE